MRSLKMSPFCVCPSSVGSLQFLDNSTAISIIFFTSYIYFFFQLFLLLRFWFGFNTSCILYVQTLIANICMSFILFIFFVISIYLYECVFSLYAEDDDNNNDGCLLKSGSFILSSWSHSTFVRMFCIESVCKWIVWEF